MFGFFSLWRMLHIQMNQTRQAACNKYIIRISYTMHYRLLIRRSLKTHGCEFLFSFLVQQCFILRMFWTVFSKPYRSLRFILCVWHVACVFCHSIVSDSFTTPWTVACQASLFMGFSRQEYWSGLPFPPPGHFPNPGIELMSPASPALAGGFLFYHWATGEAFTRRILKTRKWRKAFPVPLISSSATLYLENDRNCYTETIVFFFFS